MSAACRQELRGFDYVIRRGRQTENRVSNTVAGGKTENAAVLIVLFTHYLYLEYFWLDNMQQHVCRVDIVGFLGRKKARRVLTFIRDLDDT